MPRAEAPGRRTEAAILFRSLTPPGGPGQACGLQELHAAAGHAHDGGLVVVTFTASTAVPQELRFLENAPRIRALEGPHSAVHGESALSRTSFKRLTSFTSADPPLDLSWPPSLFSRPILWGVDLLQPVEGSESVKAIDDDLPCTRDLRLISHFPSLDPPQGPVRSCLEQRPREHTPPKSSSMQSPHPRQFSTQ